MMFGFRVWLGNKLFWLGILEKMSVTYFPRKEVYWGWKYHPIRWLRRRLCDLLIKAMSAVDEWATAKLDEGDSGGAK